MSYCPQIVAIVGGADSLCGILNDKKIVATGNIQNGIHIATNSCVMNWYNHLGPWRNGLFNESLVNVHCIGAYVHKHGDPPPQDKGIRGGDKSVAWHNELITRLNVAQDGRHLKRCRATMG